MQKNILLSLLFISNDFTKALAWLINNPIGTNITSDDEDDEPAATVQPSTSIEEHNQLQVYL